MCRSSNNRGRAYEFIFLETLYEQISPIRNVYINTTNSSYAAAHRAYDSIDDMQRAMLAQAAKAAIQKIFELEPRIIENSNDVLELMIQPDTRGELGDVRDIIIRRHNIQWEIGLSLKINHFAAKHSRLGYNLDFGQKWFGIRCSEQYWNAVNPIFTCLSEWKEENMRWRDIPDKEISVYRPILQAFIEEIRRAYDINGDIVPKRMIEYILGQFDFYKVIGLENRRLTEIQAFNLHGHLNKPSTNIQTDFVIPVSELPTRIIDIGFKPNSNNTVELYLDSGWQLSFRIHSASTRVETSLKFDIQIIGMPATIITINCNWQEIQ